MMLTERETVACQLGKIRDMLELQTSTELGLLVADPAKPADYAALCRMALTKRQDPSAWFARLVETRLAEVEQQLSEGLRALEIAGRVRRVFLVTPKQHLIDLLSADDIESRNLSRADARELVIAATAVPPDMLSTCAICGKPFIRRNCQQHVCRRQDETGRLTCVRENERQRRLARKERSAHEVS